jgi:hypothetical protein
MPPWLPPLLVASGVLGPLAGLWAGLHYRRAAGRDRAEARRERDYWKARATAPAAAGDDDDGEPARAGRAGGSENWYG